VEHITGPFHGFWLACYTVETPEGKFHAYAKICESRPSDVWEGCCAVHKVCAGPFDDAADAIHLLVQHTAAKLGKHAARNSR
jgi:hypothetical protein